MLTQEQKTAIYEDYKDRNNKVTVIAAKYGIDRAEVTRIAVGMGAEPRKSTYGRRFTISKPAKKTCPNCRKAIDIKGAKFCCYCGSDIRSNRELLIERIDKAKTNIMLMPTDARDEMIRLFAEIIEELKR